MAIVVVLSGRELSEQQPFPPPDHALKPPTLNWFIETKTPTPREGAITT